MTPDELTREIEQARWGWVCCDWRARSRRGPGPREEELDAYLAEVKLADLGDGEMSWPPGSGGLHEISLPEAKRLLTHWIRYSLAYGARAGTNFGQQRAGQLIDEFLGVFTGTVELYTNTTAEPGSSSWTYAPRTRHTFDSGVVALDERTIGVLWFAEED